MKFSSPPHREILTLLANYIRENRLYVEMTMEELSNRSGIGIATLARVEKTGICTTENLLKIIVALDLQSDLKALLQPKKHVTFDEFQRVKKVTKRQRGKSKNTESKAS